MSVPDKQIRKLDLKMSKYPPNICKNISRISAQFMLPRSTSVNSERVKQGFENRVGAPKELDFTLELR